MNLEFGLEAARRLFSSEAFSFRMGLHPGDSRDFFSPSSLSRQLLAERTGVLESRFERCVLYDEGLNASALIAEWSAQLAAWGLAARASEESALDACGRIGRTIEPDFLLLGADSGGELRLAATCVCFPSSWDPREKIGRSISEIHAPVPRLNPALGSRIEEFLKRLRPGQSFARENWGLTNSPQNDQHPELKLPRLGQDSRPEETWLRVEHQIFLRLQTAVVFGIRISSQSLSILSQDPTLRAGLSLALRTMPEDIAVYKGVDRCRDRLLALLGGAA